MANEVIQRLEQENQELHRQIRELLDRLQNSHEVTADLRARLAAAIEEYQRYKSAALDLLNAFNREGEQLKSIAREVTAKYYLTEVL